MNNIMKNKLKSLLIFIAFSTLLVSCTSDFEALNINPNEVSEEQSQADFIFVGGPFQTIFLNIYRYDPAWHTQLQHNLNADTYCGYMAPPRPFVGGANTTNYAFIDFWDQFPWDIPYSSAGTMANVALVQERGGDDFPIMNAIASILKVEAMHRVTDVYGPIVYSKFGEISDFSEYDSQEQVYSQFFDQLEAAITTLSADLASTQFAAFDLVYGGNVETWVKFANTLRLRLAIRIAKVDPAKAKLEGEKSLSNSIGLLSGNNENFLIQGGATHPLTVFNSSWDDVRMNASMESILVGYDDARANVLFEDSSVTSGEVKGLRKWDAFITQLCDRIRPKGRLCWFF